MSSAHQIINLNRQGNIAVVIVFVIMIGLISFRYSGDFKIYWKASKVAFQGNNPYNTLTDIDRKGNLVTYDEYLYSPFFLILIYPFTKLPVLYAAFIWNLIGCFFLYRTF